MAQHLTQDFLAELLKYCFTNKKILELSQDHLKYNYIPTDYIKKIYKSISSYYSNNNELPTYGFVSQQHSNDLEVQEYLEKIKKCDFINIDTLLVELEDYIKKVRFQILHKKTFDLYNDDKSDEAIELTAQESESIVNFNLKRESGRFIKLFEDFEEDVKEKEIKKQSGEFDRDKVPTGIKELDEAIFGGIDEGDTFIALTRSGVGKSTFLKYAGVYAARLGYDVMHVQLEGSKKECFDKYTQVWTALKYPAVKYADIDSDVLKKLLKISHQMQQKKRDVHIYAFEMFDEASCKDILKLGEDFYKINGKYPDVILIDSIDLLHPGDSNKYGISTEAIKKKKENSAQKIKNIATQLSTRVLTVDQADNVPKEQWNDPTWHMTRNNISGAKNLFNSFSYSITFNQTEAEKEQDVMRLYFDKLRNYPIKNRSIKIATNYDHGRFYDPQRTKELDQTINTVRKIRGKKGKL
jgi:replicative DNA helicase